MATGGQVLDMLIPTGGWVIRNNEWAGVEFIEAQPITKEQFEAGFAQYDALEAKQNAEKLAAREALLAKLGITADEAKLLLS